MRTSSPSDYSNYETSNSQPAKLSDRDLLEIYSRNYENWSINTGAQVSFSQGALISNTNSTKQYSAKAVPLVIAVAENIVIGYSNLAAIPIEDETDRLRRLRSIGDGLFCRPDINWSPEARIAHRENENRKALAKRKRTLTKYRPMSIQEVRAQIISHHGKCAWEKLLAKEAEIKALERWQRED